MAAESIINRKALRDYHIVDRYEAGIELKGSEVKSIRAGKANIGDAFARIENGEAFLYNADIQPYERASHEIPTAKRIRKLLLHREEIDRLYGETQVKGRTLVVLKLYWKNGKVKAEVGVGTGKLAHDKRADLKKRALIARRRVKLRASIANTRNCPTSDAPCSLFTAACSERFVSDYRVVQMNTRVWLGAGRSFIWRLDNRSRLSHGAIHVAR
jgi:SsrA-binding protein